MTVTDMPHKYRMTISRRTIDQLGIKLYDKVSAVLAELIANSYDADAELVTITLPLDTFLAKKEKGEVQDLAHEIRVEDTGIGMTADQVNEYYLRVGPNRRITRGDRSLEKERPVMGRKGIGKLAPFGICREIEVVTAGGSPVPGGYTVSNLILRYASVVTETDDEYYPDVGPLDGSVRPNRGTTIILRAFDRRRVPDRDSLERQLCARFGISRDDWTVKVIDSEKKQQAFVVGDLNVPVMEGTRVELEGRPVILEDGTTLGVTGWIAYAKQSYKDETMAGIRIYARGKIVAQTRDFDVQSGFTGEYKLRSYLVGVVHADWLDQAEDLIRSDRQDIIWNSEYGHALKLWGHGIIRDLAKSAETSVRSKVWEEFLEQSKLEERLLIAFPKDAEARASVVNAAKTMVKGNDRDMIHSDPDYVQSLVDLAFAIGPHRDLLRALQDVSDDAPTTLGSVVKLFGKAKIAETYTLGQVASERVQAVDKLRGLIVSTGTDEAQLQELVEKAPWILAPEWTPITMNRRLNDLRDSFERWYEKEYGAPISTTTIDRPGKRPDFVLLSVERTLQIVEIKRPDWRLTKDELDRAVGYRDAVRKFLDDNPVLKDAFAGVLLTIICDGLNLKSPVHESAMKNDRGIKRRTWHEVLDGCQKTHGDFLEEVRRMQGLKPKG